MVLLGSGEIFRSSVLAYLRAPIGLIPRSLHRGLTSSFRHYRQALRKLTSKIDLPVMAWMFAGKLGLLAREAHARNAAPTCRQRSVSGLPHHASVPPTILDPAVHPLRWAPSAKPFLLVSRGIPTYVWGSRSARGRSSRVPAWGGRPTSA